MWKKLATIIQQLYEFNVQNQININNPRKKNVISCDLNVSKTLKITMCPDHTAFPHQKHHKTMLKHKISLCGSV